MALSNQSTKLRLLKLLQYSLATQPNTAVSLSELGRTLSISRERVRQLYRQLAMQYTLPPVKKGGSGINRYNQVVVKAEQWALAQQVKALREKRVHYKQIQKKLGISRYQISQAIKQLRRAKDTVFRLPSQKTLAFEAEVRKYSKQGMTVAEIARRTERPVPTIYDVLRRLKMPFNHAPRPKRRDTQALETEVRTYSKQGMTVAEIAKKVRKPPRTIYTVLHRLGVHLRKRSNR